jgi:hypothetical protein
MPTFNLTDAEINTLMKYFLGLSDQDLQIRDYEGYHPDPELLPVGKEVFTLFQCANCHPSRDVTPGEGGVTTADLAPKLELARGRLKPEWIVEWLADPAKLQPGTRMPTYFPDGESPLPDVLDGDAKKQMMAIRDYVISLGRSGKPLMSSR